MHSSGFTYAFFNVFYFHSECQLEGHYCAPLKHLFLIFLRWEWHLFDMFRASLHIFEAPTSFYILLPLFLFGRRQIDHVLSHKLNQGHFHLVQRLHYILELKKTQRFSCLLFLAFIILCSSDLSEHMCTLIKITKWLKQYIKWQDKISIELSSSLGER